MRRMSPWRAAPLLALPLLALATGGAAEPTRAIDADALLSFCRSQTLATAAAKGDALGWTRVADGPADADWRAAVLSAQGGVGHAVQWTRKAGDKTESLTFWTVRGPTSYNSCSYSTTGTVDAWLDALTTAIGTPSLTDKVGNTRTDAWTVGAMQVFLTHAGAETLIEMGTSL